MAPPPKPETAKLLKDTLSSVDSTGKLFAKVAPRFKKMSAALAAAIDQGSTAKIELYRPELEKVVDEIDNCLKGAKSSLALIGFLKKDEEFLASRFDTIEKLTTKVADIETALLDHRQVATGLDTKALAALNKLAHSTHEKLGDLAVLKDSYNDLEKAIEYLEKEGARHEADARKAHGAGKQKELSAARVRFLDLGYTQQELGATKLSLDVKRFLKNNNDKELMRQAQEMVDGLPGLIERCKAMSKLGVELVQLKVAGATAHGGPATKNPAFEALRKEYKALGDKLIAMEKTGDQLESLTRKAQAKGDAKAMSEARVKFLNLDYTKGRLDTDRLLAATKKFANDNAIAKTDKADLQELLDYLPEYRNRFAELSKKGNELALLKVAASQSTKSAEPAKLNMVQAAKIGDKLGIDVGMNAKLLKVLNAFPHDKWVKEIAKACDLKEADLKNKMPNVNRLDFVKPLYLIDI